MDPNTRGVRFGIAGLGNMGSFHVESFAGLKDASLTAIADSNPKKLERAGQKTSAARFERYQDMLASGLIDAVIVATPHYQHPEIALAAFDKNIHVLCEKPIAVSVSDARRINAAAAAHPQLKFGIMFQQRTLSLYRKLRELIAEGELGEI